MTSTPPTTSFNRGPSPGGPAAPGGPASPAALAARPGPGLATPGARRQRRWSLALVALLVTLGSALAFVVLWLNAGNREPVLALARDVPAGQIIVDDDLTTVRISTDSGIRPVASSARDQVVGQPAAADLLAGTLLTPDSVGDNDGLTSDEMLVAIPLPAREAPDLEAGNLVELWRPPSSSGSDEDPRGVLIGDGVVADVTREEGDSEVRVTVRIGRNLAADVTGAVGVDQIVILRTGAG